MKKYLLGLILVLISLIGNKIYGQCTSCTINISSNSNQSYSLGKNDVLCIQSGVTFSGGINNMHKDAILCIDSGTTYNAPYINNWNGTLNNYGTLDLSSATINGNGRLVNMGNIIMSNPNMNGNASLTNTDGSSIEVIGNLNLSGNNSLINDGDLSVTGNMTFTGSANFENNGTLEVEGNLDLNKLLENHGYLRIKGNINNNSGVHNYCMFISDKGFSNSGNDFRNEGFIWVLGTHPAQFANSGTFYQSPGAQFRGVHFANSGNITGGGDYYFSGNTANSAYVGHDGGGINFYDASNNNPSLYFDQQAVAPHSSVSKNPFAPADTSSWGGGGNANAGDDQLICEDETQLNADGTNGKWSIVSGSVNIADINDPNSLVSEIDIGENILMWSENASCGTASDLVKITLENEADTTIWTGNIDNNWHNPDNWTNCVPGQATFTLIPNTATSPEIKTGYRGYALKIKVESDANLRVKSNAKLIVAFRDEE